eukprot:scaffold59992_cov21-Phaeocystis_antarctica.AAC.1
MPSVLQWARVRGASYSQPKRRTVALANQPRHMPRCVASALASLRRCRSSCNGTCIAARKALAVLPG